MAPNPVLETAIMDVVWDHDSWLTPGEIRAAIGKRVAPTTVATVLSRLHAKGRLHRRPRGKAFEYRATQTREEYVAAIMEDALDRSHDRPLALLEFVDRLPQDDRTRLRRILRR